MCAGLAFLSLSREYDGNVKLAEFPGSARGKVIEGSFMNDIDLISMVFVVGRSNVKTPLMDCSICKIPTHAISISKM